MCDGTQEHQAEGYSNRGRKMARRQLIEGGIVQVGALRGQVGASGAR